jgi:bacterial microcompartment shell protein
MARRERFSAFALLELEGLASGVAASDLMVKRAPIALLRCGTVHPGRFLVLVGGSVASVEEAHRAGVERGLGDETLHDEVLLADLHPQLHDALLGSRRALAGDALAVVETTTSPALLRALDAAVKSSPIEIGVVRLADDLGGRAVALLSGSLTDAQTALAICVEAAGERLFATSLLPRLDDDLRRLLEGGTEFRSCELLEPAGAEHPEEMPCSWAG